MMATQTAVIMLPVLLTLCQAAAASDVHHFMQSNDVDRIPCPGCQWVCENDETCCQMLSGDWGCCFMPNAVCCADGRTCCPHGHWCNAKKLRCDPDVTVNMTIVRSARSQQPVTVIQAADVELVCPDHSQCPTPGAACCRQYTGRYGCCLYPNNVCCDDGVHCCPKGTVCDQLRMVCLPYPSSSPALQQLKPARRPGYYGP